MCDAHLIYFRVNNHLHRQAGSKFIIHKHRCYSTHTEELTRAYERNLHVSTLRLWARVGNSL